MSDPRISRGARSLFDFLSADPVGFPLRALTSVYTGSMNRTSGRSASRLTSWDLTLLTVLLWRRS